MKKILLPALFFAGWMALLNTDLPVKGSFLPSGWTGNKKNS